MYGTRAVGFEPCASACCFFALQVDMSRVNEFGHRGDHQSDQIDTDAATDRGQPDEGAAGGTVAKKKKKKAL